MTRYGIKESEQAERQKNDEEQYQLAMRILHCCKDEVKIGGDGRNPLIDRLSDACASVTLILDRA